MTSSRIASRIPADGERHAGAALRDPALLQRLVETGVVAVAVATGLAALAANLLALWRA